ncbi:MAG: hypothetical protein RIC06_01710 [Cyclobacteriaceae bacterium]
MHLLYEEWKQSGESQTVFANRKGIRPTTFYYWTSKIGKDSSTPPKRQNSGFDPITIDHSPLGMQGQAMVIIQYPSGARLELHAPVEAHFLRALVE